MVASPATDRHNREVERFTHHLRAIAAKWEVIFIVPLLVGAITYLYFSSGPDLYRSNAVLRLSPEEVIILKSPRVFGAALKSVRLEPNASATVAVVSLDSPDAYQVTVSANSAARAAAILQEMIAMLPDETMPSAATQDRLEHRLGVLKDSVASLSAALEGMNSVFAKVVHSDATADSLSSSGDFGQSFAVLAASIAAKDLEIAAVQAAQQPTFTADDVILPPTVPVNPIARTVGPFVTLAIVLVFAILLAFVLFAAALRRSIVAGFLSPDSR
jgi:hypothetical protein